MERVSPNHNNFSGVKAAGIAALSLVLGAGCVSPEERAVKDGFLREGETRATAPQEKENKKPDEAKAPEKKDGTGVPQVSEGVINVRYPSSFGGGVGFRKIDGTEVIETVHGGQIRGRVIGNTFFGLGGSVGYASARTDAGYQDSTLTHGRVEIEHAVYNDGKQEGRLFGDRAFTLRVHGGYMGENLDGAFLKNRTTPYAGGGFRWVHRGDGLEFQASGTASHSIGGTEEQKFGLNGDRKGWTGRVDASAHIDGTVGDSGTTVFGWGNLERTRTELETQVDGMGPVRIRTKGADYHVGGGVVQGFGDIIQIGPTARYGSSQTHYDSTMGTRPGDKRTELVIGGIGIVNFPYGLQLIIEGGKDFRNKETQSVQAGLGVRF